MFLSNFLQYWVHCSLCFATAPPSPLSSLSFFPLPVLVELLYFQRTWCPTTPMYLSSRVVFHSWVTITLSHKTLCAVLWSSHWSQSRPSMQLHSFETPKSQLAGPKQHITHRGKGGLSKIVFISFISFLDAPLQWHLQLVLPKKPTLNIHTSGQQYGVQEPEP